MAVPDSDYMQAFMSISVGVVPYLEKLPGVSNVIVDERTPAERHQLLMWEQKNSCFLPDDMKSFFMTTNGVKLSWCFKFDDDILPIGLMEVNSIDKLTKVCESKQAASDPTIADLQCDRAKVQTPLAKSVHGFPHFDGRSRIFELDACRDCGKVCLVYHNTETGSPAQGAEVWFLDRSFRWHFLTDSFSEYFQMMLVHLGLPEWQYIFTDIGLSPQVQTWFHMFAPMRLVIDAEDKAKPFFQREGDTAAISEVTLDNNRVFKAKADKRAKSGNQKKKANQTKSSASRTCPPSSSSRGR